LKGAKYLVFIIGNFATSSWTLLIVLTKTALLQNYQQLSLHEVVLV